MIETFRDAHGVDVDPGMGDDRDQPAGGGVDPSRGHATELEIEYRVKSGRVVAGVEIRLTAEDGTVLPRDGKTVGEFEIRGPWITGSYFGVDDPEKFRDGWLRTGDIGTLDAEGFMDAQDRSKDVIKSGGEWISSVELEVTVMAHPAVFEAAVIAVPDEQMAGATAVLRGPPARGDGERRTSCETFLPIAWPSGGCPSVGPSSRASPRPVWASSTRRCCAPSTPRASSRSWRRLVESFDALADEVGALERRVTDAIFDTVRAQLRADGADEAKELERQLSKVRRSLQKAEHLLRDRAED